MFVTVFFAIVLFFAGISLRFSVLSIRIGILALAGVLLVYGVARIGTLPRLECRSARPRQFPMRSAFTVTWFAGVQSNVPAFFGYTRTNLPFCTCSSTKHDEVTCRRRWRYRSCLRR